MTELPTQDYLTSSELYAYFLNIVGFIHYTLPGVFGGQQINVQLWTIPFELECYILLMVVTIAGLVDRKILFGILVAAIIAAFTILAVQGVWYQQNWNVPGRILVLSFLFGVLAYLFRMHLPHNKFLFLMSIASCYVLLMHPNLVFLAVAPIAYVTIYIGLLRLPKIPFGDLSYGIYLFHFPIARALHEFSEQTLSWGWLILATLLLSGAFAAMSWRYIEKPVLDRKKLVLSWVSARTSWLPRRAFRIVAE